MKNYFVEILKFRISKDLMPVSSSTSPATLNRTRPSLPALSDSHFRIYRTKWEIRKRRNQNPKGGKRKGQGKRFKKQSVADLVDPTSVPNVVKQATNCWVRNLQSMSNLDCYQSIIYLQFNLANLRDVSWLGCNWTIDWVSCFKNQPQPNPFEENMRGLAIRWEADMVRNCSWCGQL